MNGVVAVFAVATLIAVSIHISLTAGFLVVVGSFALAWITGKGGR